MNLYKGLLFLHGHVASADLATRLAEDRPAPAVSEPVVAKRPAGKRAGRVWRALRRNLSLLGGRPMTAGHNDDIDEPLAWTRCAQRRVCRTLAAGGFR